MRTVLLLCFALLNTSVALAQNLSARIPQVENQGVILVHGLNLQDESLFLIEQRLPVAGYEVVNLDYPSSSATIETVVRNRLESSDPVRFIDEKHFC
jgi:triacylglycerol esterase/lipase EstA (alpha/beta hydrolase family)